jgi:hypothetical protein
MIRFLINPFEKIAGAKSLIFGIIIMVLTAFISTFNYFIPDGLIGFHFYYLTLLDNLLNALIILVVASLTYYIAGIIVSKSKIRFIDVMGTFSLSRFPYLILALLAFLFPINKFWKFLVTISNPDFSVFTSFEKFYLVAFFILGLVAVIWSVSLMFNAFRISCNLKGTKAVISFIISTMLAFIVSFVLFVIFVYNPFD